MLPLQPSLHEALLDLKLLQQCLRVIVYQSATAQQDGDGSSKSATFRHEVDLSYLQNRNQVCTCTRVTSSCTCCSCVLEAMAPYRDRTPLMSLLTTLPYPDRAQCSDRAKLMARLCAVEHSWHFGCCRPVPISGCHPQLISLSPWSFQTLCDHSTPGNVSRGCKLHEVGAEPEMSEAEVDDLYRHFRPLVL